jgi:hypothetical protein
MTENEIQIIADHLRRATTDYNYPDYVIQNTVKLYQHSSTWSDYIIGSNKKPQFRNVFIPPDQVLSILYNNETKERKLPGRL